MISKQRNDVISDYMEKKASADIRVLAIRDDSMVGKGTDSVADKLTDWEIMQELDQQNIKKATFARMYFRKAQRIKNSIRF